MAYEFDSLELLIAIVMTSILRILHSGTEKKRKAKYAVKEFSKTDPNENGMHTEHFYFY